MGFDYFTFDDVHFDERTPAARLSPFGSIRFNDMEYIGQTLWAGTVLTQEINDAIWTFECTLRVAAHGACPVTVGATALVYDRNNVLVFDGYVARLTPVWHARGTGPVLGWRVFCQDGSRLLDATMTGAAVFTSQYDGVIIRHLMSVYLPAMNTGNVADVVVLPALDLSYRTLRECLAQIAGLTNAVWYRAPGSALYYHDVNARQSPIAVVSGETEANSTRMLDTATYTEEFTTPCNRCTVQNMIAEQSTQSSYSPPATGDDGDVSRVSSGTEYPPVGSYTVDTTSATMTARHQRINPLSDQGGYTTGGADDGHTWRLGLSYPPGDQQGTETGGNITVASGRHPDGFYVVSVGLMFFDTSNLPDACEVTAARLEIGVVERVDDGISGPHLGIEWYAGDNRPIDDGDWTSTPSNNAYGYVRLHEVGSTLELSSGNEYINRTGYSGLRLHCYIPSQVPQGNNYIVLAEGARLVVDYRYGGTSYRVACTLLRFDTSALPDTAQISGATLKLKVAGKANTDGMSVLMEWYVGANWPIDSNDWTMDPASPAIIWYGPIGGLPAVGSWLIVPLMYVSTGINLTGYTGIRILVWGAPFGGPTGDNSASFATQESADAPVLEISYVPGEMISGTYEDLTSQAAYGVFEERIVDAEVLSVAAAQLHAESVVVRQAYPRRQLAFTVLRGGLSVGQMLHVQSTPWGISGNFLIRRVTTHCTVAREVVYGVDVGDFRHDLIGFLRRNINASP